MSWNMCILCIYIYILYMYVYICVCVLIFIYPNHMTQLRLNFFCFYLNKQFGTTNIFFHQFRELDRLSTTNCAAWLWWVNTYTDSCDLLSWLSFAKFWILHMFRPKVNTDLPRSRTCLLIDAYSIPNMLKSGLSVWRSRPCWSWNIPKPKPTSKSSFL